MQSESAPVDPAARCRLCAAHEAIKVDIFGDEGRSRNLVNKIETCLPITVECEDRLPKFLCYRCMYLLEKFYNFRISCVTAAELLRVCVDEHESRAIPGGESHRYEDLEQQLCSMKKEVQHDVMPTLEIQVASSPKPAPVPGPPSPDVQEVAPVIDLEAPKSSPAQSKRPKTKSPTKLIHSKTLSRLSLQSRSVLKPSVTNKPGQSKSSPRIPHRIVQSERTMIRANQSNASGDKDVIDLTDEPGPSRVGRTNGELLKETLLQVRRRRSGSVEIEEVGGRKRVSSTKAVENVVNMLNDEAGGSSRRKNARPRKIAQPDEARPYACMLCDKSFSLKNALSRHFNASHGVEMADVSVSSPRQPVEVVDLDSSTLRCEICTRSFNDRPSLWLHLLYTHKEAAPYACGLCLKLFPDNTALSRHWKGHYATGQADTFSLDRRYSCEICGRQDNSRKKLVKHLKVHIFDGGLDPDMLIIVNSDCYDAVGRSFDFGDFDVSQDASFTSSMIVGDDVMPYHPCNLCFKAFETEETLAKHRKLVHKVVITCEVCQEVFDSEERLMRHVTAEHFDGNHMLADQPFNPFEPLVDFSSGVDLYYCKYCSHEFTTMEAVSRHQRSCKSAGPKKLDLSCSHHCEICKKSFVSEDCLVKHKKGAHKESAEDPDVGYNAFYFCELCGSSHATKVGRWRHVISSHADEPSIRCDYESCGKIFVAESLCLEHRSHHQLQGKTPNTCELCGKLWNSTVEFWKHVQGVHAEMLPLICGICLKMFGEVESLVYHVGTTHKLDEGSFHCSTCARKYSNQSKLSRHQAIHSAVAKKSKVVLKTPPAKRPVVVKKPTDGESNVLWCDVCPDVENFSDAAALAEHRRSVHSLHPCDFCDKFYGRNSHLWKHVNKKHRGHPEITCTICQKVSATKTQLFFHYRKIHKSEMGVQDEHILTIPTFLPGQRSRQYATHDCRSCGKTFLKRAMLSKHQAVCLKRARQRKRAGAGVGAAQRHECDKCGLSVETRGRLTDHKRSAHKSSPCENCDETFPTLPSLLDHLLSAHPSLRCLTCSALTRSPSDLATHTAHHATTPHPPYCRACACVLPTITRAWHHLNAHHKPDVPFTCGVCLERLPDTAALQAHARENHPEAVEADHTCRICAKTYSTNYKVAEHVRKYHAGYDACRECLACFSDAAQLERHARDVHGNNSDDETVTEKVNAEEDGDDDKVTKAKEVDEDGDKEKVIVKAKEVDKVTVKAKDAEKDKVAMQRAKRSYSCYKCPMTFGKPSELSGHKRRRHGSTGLASVKSEPGSEEDMPVLEPNAPVDPCKSPGPPADLSMPTLSEAALDPADLHQDSSEPTVTDETEDVATEASVSAGVCATDRCADAEVLSKVEDGGARGEDTIMDTDADVNTDKVPMKSEVSEPPADVCATDRCVDAEVADRGARGENTDVDVNTDKVPMKSEVLGTTAGSPVKVAAKSGHFLESLEDALDILEAQNS